ncbi:MAG: AAA family ATPase [Ignavibacteriaceae bacterium]
MIGQAERLIKLRNLEKNKSQSDDLKVISFTSGKGGTGKTFISLSIAYILSTLNKKVLFIDADLNFANSNILLNIIPRATIDNFFKGNNLLKDVITEYNSNFHLIFGESGESEPLELKDELVDRLFNNLNKLKESYDFIIFDTASGGHKGLVNLLSLSDINIIVTSPEPTAVMDAYVMVKLLNNEKYKGKKLILVNKCSDEEEGETAFNNIKTASGYFLKDNVEFLGYLNYDEKVFRSIIKQEFLIKNNPSAQTCLRLTQLSRSLTDIIQLANIPHSIPGPIANQSNF